MRGTSPIANQSGQMMLQNQLLQAASQMTSIGQIETTDEGRSVLRDGSSAQASGLSGQTGGNASGSFSGVAPDRGVWLIIMPFWLRVGWFLLKAVDLMQDKWTKESRRKD